MRPGPNRQQQTAQLAAAVVGAAAAAASREDRQTGTVEAAAAFERHTFGDTYPCCTRGECPACVTPEDAR